jgi:hypothetical protein
MNSDRSSIGDISLQCIEHLHLVGLTSVVSPLLTVQSVTLGRVRTTRRVNAGTERTA